MKIDGKQIANDILINLKIEVDKLKTNGVTPHLSIILIGNNASSESYIKQKKLKGEEIGVEIEVIRFDEITQEKLLEVIRNLNQNPKVNGIIVQRPMPKNINKDVISEAIDPDKDVDGFRKDSNFDAPVALAIIEILKNANLSIEDLNSKKITIVGRGETAGGPIIKLFTKLNIPFEQINSQTPDPNQILLNSDVIISAVGKEGIIKETDVKPGAILIGVGMFEKMGKLKSDYEVTEIENKASFFTPTPGGVGPVNVAFLMKNLIKASVKESYLT